MTDSTKRIAQSKLLKRARAAYRRSVRSVAVQEAMHRAMRSPDVMAVSPVAGLQLSSSPDATSSFEKCASLPEEGCLAEPASVQQCAPQAPQFPCVPGSSVASRGAEA